MPLSPVAVPDGDTKTTCPVASNRFGLPSTTWTFTVSARSLSSPWVTITFPLYVPTFVWKLPSNASDETLIGSVELCAGRPACEAGATASATEAEVAAVISRAMQSLIRFMNVSFHAHQCSCAHCRKGIPDANGGRA